MGFFDYLASYLPEDFGETFYQRSGLGGLRKASDWAQENLNLRRLSEYTPEFTERIPLTPRNVVRSLGVGGRAIGALPAFAGATWDQPDIGVEDAFAATREGMETGGRAAQEIFTPIDIASVGPGRLGILGSLVDATLGLGDITAGVEDKSLARGAMGLARVAGNLANMPNVRQKPRPEDIFSIDELRNQVERMSPVGPEYERLRAIVDDADTKAIAERFEREKPDILEEYEPTAKTDERLRPEEWETQEARDAEIFDEDLHAQDMSSPAPRREFDPLIDTIEDTLASPRKTFETRFQNMTQEYLERIKDRAAEILQDPGVKDISIRMGEIKGKSPAYFNEETNTIWMDPRKMQEGDVNFIADTLTHEIAHRYSIHGMGDIGVAPANYLGGIPGVDLTTGKPKDVSVKRGYTPIGEGKFAEVDPRLVEHREEFIPERAKFSKQEHAFQTAVESLQNDPYIRSVRDRYAQNQKRLQGEEFRRERGLPTFEEEGGVPPALAAPIEPDIVHVVKTARGSFDTVVTDVTREIKGETYVQVRTRPTGTDTSFIPEWVPLDSLDTYMGRSGNIPESQSAPAPKTGISEPADIFRKILTEAKLTRFNKNTIVKELENAGIKVPDELRTQIPELLEELKSRGWVNEKIAGTMTLQVEPPKRVTEIEGGKTKPEEVTVDLEDALRDSIEFVGERPKITPKVQEPTAPKPKPIAQQMQEKLTPEEIDAINAILGKEKLPAIKGGTPEEVRLAQEAAKGGGEKPPSKKLVSAEEKRSKKAFKVTLSDGTEHIVKAPDADSAKTRAEQVLGKYKSTKTVDKVEPSLSTLEKAAKYEVEPTKQGFEVIGEEVVAKKQTQKFEELAQEKELKSQLKAESDFAKAEERLRKQSEKKAEAEARAKARKATESLGILDNPAVKVLNAVKSIAYGGDVGHLLRQGKQMNADLLFSKDARKIIPQFGVIFKSAKSEKFFQDFHEKLYSDPVIKKFVDDFNLDMPGLGKHLKEEVFHGAGLAEKIPLIGKYYAKPSERAYTAGLNYLRAVEAKRFAENLQKRGFTPENAPEKYNAVARALNIISQRGHFSPAYQKVFSDLSAIYGAPRAKAARLQNAAELFRGGESPNIIRTTAAKTLAFNTAMYGILAATVGAKFVTDPESGDFMKIRINDKITIDPWVGLGVTARTAAKLITEKKISPYTGQPQDISAEEALTTEFMSGVAPGVRLTYELWKGKDFRGYQVDRLAALLNIAPLTAKGVAELLQTGDIESALALSMLQATGESVDVFDYEKAQEKERKLKIERGVPVGKSRKKKKKLTQPIY